MHSIKLGRASLLLAAVGALSVACASRAGDATGESADAASIAHKTLRSDGNWDITCRSSSGVTWTTIATPEAKDDSSICRAITFAGDKRDVDGEGFIFVKDKAEDHRVSFTITQPGTYSLIVDGFKEWLGNPDHDKAGELPMLAMTVDGQCAGARAIEGAGDEPSRVFIRVPFEAGEHTVGLSFTNDYWDEAKGNDRNLWVGPLRVYKTRWEPHENPNGAAACEAKGEYPKPTVTNPFEDDACPGVALSHQEIIETFDPGTTRRSIGDFELYQRSRACAQATGCAAWSAPVRATKGGVSLVASGTLNVYGENINSWSSSKRYLTSVDWRFNATCSSSAAGCRGGGGDDRRGPATMSCSGFTPFGGSDYYWRADGTRVNTCNSNGAARGTFEIKPTCMRYTGHYKKSGNVRDTWTDYEYVAIRAR